MTRLSRLLPTSGRFAFVAACVSMVSLGATICPAQVGTPQYRSPQYQPARPTISPYINLLRKESGPVPNYYSLVRPQLQQNAFNEQQQAIDQRQQQFIGQQQQQIQTLNQGLMELKPASIRPTGTAGNFNNRLHYYPNAAAKGRR